MQRWLLSRRPHGNFPAQMAPDRLLQRLQAARLPLQGRPGPPVAPGPELLPAADGLAAAAPATTPGRRMSPDTQPGGIVPMPEPRPSLFQSNFAVGNGTISGPRGNRT